MALSGSVVIISLKLLVGVRQTQPLSGEMFMAFDESFITFGAKRKAQHSASLRKVQK